VEQDYYNLLTRYGSILLLVTQFSTVVSRMIIVSQFLILFTPLLLAGFIQVDEVKNHD